MTGTILETPNEVMFNSLCRLEASLNLYQCHEGALQQPLTYQIPAQTLPLVEWNTAEKFQELKYQDTARKVIRLWDKNALAAFLNNYRQPLR